MAATSSTMLALGTKVPDFKLQDVVTGGNVSPSTYEDKKALLVMFVSRHCPYVMHVKGELSRLGVDYVPKGVGIIAISSNDVANYPDDSPANLKAMALELKLNYPLCFDETQVVAKAYQAACTPEFYLFDGDQKLVYRGQLDDSRPKSDIPVTGKDLRVALDALLSGGAIPVDQKPGIGCNIKWKPGNEPDYYSR